MHLMQTKRGFIYTFELVQGEHAKVWLQDWAAYPCSVPLTGTTGFGGHAEKPYNCAGTCLITVPFKNFHFCGMSEATVFKWEFQLKS